jgi:glycosyltransferase involved in cell wall biosynthesis
VTTWHVISGEYPPQRGGVSDYTYQLARGLAQAGDRVEIWAPPCNGDDRAAAERADPHVTVHRLPDMFGLRSLWYLSRALSRFPAPRRLLVQYVPHAFGRKGANIPFCLWLRSRRRDSTWIMFHEVMFVAERGSRLVHRALAVATRWMAALAGGSAERVFISIPGWRPLVEPLVQPYAGIVWLPVPSAIPVSADPAATAAIRARYAPGVPLVGHFGTYGAAVASLLEQTLAPLSAMSDCHVLLIGDNSERACGALIAAHSALAGRVFATGRLDAADISRHVMACDVMLQPYPDGVSTRRTSAMVALSHGRPLITTNGRLTEPMWADTDAVVLAPAGAPHALAAATAMVLSDRSRQEQVGRTGAALYDARFDVRHSVAALRSQPAH